MDTTDRREIERNAKDLRREEISRLLDAAVCALRAAIARLRHRPAPCPPGARMAAH